MPPQHVETAETIAALKRALRRSNRAASSVPIAQASNRGNKLKRGAEFVHQGSLAYIKGPEAYKEKIDHAGYTRYILDRNPIRYNKYGDEIEDDESDEEADALAAEENAYSGLKLEELLRPLKHPSDLSHHPALAEPYTSKALPNMIQATNNQLRKEKADLARAKDLHRQLIGDEAWIPCETVETPEDWDLFEPRFRGNVGAISAGKKRKRGEDGQEYAGSVSSTLQNASVPDSADAGPVHIDQDTVMADATSEQEQSKDDRDDQAGSEKPLTDAEPQTEKQDHAIAKRRNQKEDTNTHEPTTDGDIGVGRTNGQVTKLQKTTDEEGEEKGDNGREQADAASHTVSRSASASPAPPPRRITRALAQTNNNEPGDDSNAPTPPLSPSFSDTSTSLSIAPLYLIPTIRPHPSLGHSPYHLPPAEHSDTLSLLTSYIQKQSAFVSTLESVHCRLLQADRLRRTVFHWSKAEGHLGELSDGEDWIDEEAWGLEPGELKKGKGDDEDVDAQAEYLGRKGKRRRGGGGAG
ncbi:hypothetical protein UCRPC4_g06971 [Phaeomoniella chlamydospora]|uniref:Transcriptional regulatory protein RXT2 N-terminal domain-containing protein n=1 Tax=Phaeomoniella chlamydospora TaxID=158046 RepID=A0A0G2DT80_PHACM|nr:hypothetical protein UCRPC4_g06971 [Phaeomoniella chlamydospora]